MFKEKYGQQGTKDFRRLERLHQKRARLRNHLRFCLRCRDENITPTSLQLKTPIRTKTAQNIMERAQRALLKERIRNVATKQKQVDNELERRHLDLKRNYKLDKQMEELIKGHMMEKQEKEFIKVKERHIKKLNRLINKKKREEIQDNSTPNSWHNLIGLVANSTYFTYDDTIYKQLEGFAMGNPLSATLCEFFMEDLEQKAIATAPPNYKIKLWKCYVDDILEIIPKGQTGTLTQHLNNIDDTGSIKFTYETETEGSIAFMDMKITRQTDGTLNINTYRKPTHTDQYLLWTSEHPTIHKMSVIRTLYHRANMVTEERDRKQEDKHIQHALKTCRYPTWTINKGKQQTTTERKKQPKQRTRNPERQEPKPVITLPYIRGITEKIRATMKKHNINTPTKPYTTVRNRLVHPKDKIPAGLRCGVIYEIPCKICNKTYIGETGRQLNTRTIEHRKECEKEASRKHTRAAKEEAESTIKKSAVTDHCLRENHVMDWDNTRIINTEQQKYKRWIKEAIEIRRRGCGTMNRDDGVYSLDRAWDCIIEEGRAGGGGWRCPLLPADGRRGRWCAAVGVGLGRPADAGGA
uniref:Helix-turn-helix domain-containing protein n=1 Tax=Nothobranchius pienaari TaxID=704102 RepID=A0A1A8MWI4_9TELE